MRRNKYDIKVYTRYYMRLVILFSILFIGVLWGPISLYCIEKKPINVSIIVSIFFIIFFGGIALFQYIAFAPKLYVYGNKIVIKKWYGLRRKYYVKDIDKVIFEKSEGKIVTIQIISSISKDKYIDTVENFDKLLNYLLKNVEKEKMECYILGTKEVYIGENLLFPTTYTVAKSVKKSLEQNEEEMLSVDKSIGIYAPDGEMESILFGEKGYYEFL